MPEPDPREPRPSAGQRWGLLGLVLLLVAGCVIFVDHIMAWLLGR